MLQCPLANKDIQEGRGNKFHIFSNFSRPFLVIHHFSLFSHFTLLSSKGEPKLSLQTILKLFTQNVLHDYQFYSFLLPFTPSQSLFSSTEGANSATKTDGEPWLDKPPGSTTDSVCTYDTLQCEVM